MYHNPLLRIYHIISYHRPIGRESYELEDRWRRMDWTRGRMIGAPNRISTVRHPTRRGIPLSRRGGIREVE